MISTGNHVKFAHFLLLAHLYIFYKFRSKLSVPLTVVTIFFHSVYNKTIITFSFCDIQIKQDLVKGYQPKTLTWAVDPHLDHSGYHKSVIQ